MNKKQQEYIGRGGINNLPEILRRANAKKVLLVTGKNSYQQCGAKSILTPLLENVEITVFNQFSANPVFEEAMEGVKLFNSKNCDSIVAVGGGSAIDIAKSINALQAHQGNELSIAKGLDKITRKLHPLFAIPTTAGTGSEATHFAVLYINQKKYSLASDYLLPDVAIVDSQFTDTLPSYIAACTGFDAFCQAIESFWSVNATQQSQQYAEKAIKIIVEQLLDAVEPGSTEAREQMIFAANLAGKAINISKTTAPHALSYTITSLFGLPHGHAVALVLGEFFQLHDQVIRSQNNETSDIAGLSNTMQRLYELLGVKNAMEARIKWKRMMKLCGLESDFNTIGIKSDEDISNIIAGVNIERLSNHPINLAPEMLTGVFTLETNY